MLLKVCLFFREFQPSVAYKSVAYKKKKRVVQNIDTLTINAWTRALEEL